MIAPTEKPSISALRIERAAEAAPSRGFPWRPTAAVALAAAVVAAALVYLRSDRELAVQTAPAVLTYPSQANAVLTANGYVVAQRKAAVASKGAGRLVYLGVEEGDKVVTGQVIARIEDADVRAALNKAKADLALVQADAKEATRSLARQRALVDHKVTTVPELDAAEARYDRVQAAIASAGFGVAAAEVAVENTRIRAPFDGTVLTKNADVGEVVAPFATSVSSRGAVVTIADMESLQVEADVSESNIMRVTQGQPVEIILDAYPEQRYPGRVHKIVPTADRAKATVLTKIAFDARDGRVLPEMSARVVFLAARVDDRSAAAPPRITIPANAVRERDGEKFVFTIRDGVATATPVRVGETIGALVAVNEGIREGELVVIEPPARLSSGAKVTTP